jgi:uncharacterized membrane protein (UPF0127 family)
MRLMAGVLVILAAGCGKQPVDKPPPLTNFVARIEVPPPVPTKVQPKLPTIKLFVGTVPIEAEQALTEKQIQTGMMFRGKMGPNEGMIFVHRDVSGRGYWMENCFVPLSIAYIDPVGRIVEIHDMEPHDTNSVYSASNNIKYALETPQGWFKRNGIGPGVMITTEKGTLPETYFPRR